ncbi:MAG: hypothetical protein ABGZ17_01245, partial [Planctomycetaceae bacterium]
RLEWSHDLMVDPALFASQKPVEQLVVWPDPPPTEEERRVVWSLLHGLPVAKRQTSFYRRYVVRYLATPLGDDALECRRTGADVFRDLDSRRMRYHTDVWFSEHVTFGCVQFQQTVTDQSTGEIVSRRRMTVAREGHMSAPSPLPDQ